MGNYIADNRSELSKRHYVRKASAQNYWFDFTANKVKRYQQQYGMNFCLIIYGSDLIDDAYIMPYIDVSSLFSEHFLDARNRWIGNIRNNIILLTPGGRSLSVSPYYNAFELLDIVDHPIPRAIHDAGVSYNADGPDDPEELKRKIQAFNAKYRTTVPHKRHIISDQVARPGAITDYLKALCKYSCQICSEPGFLQANGTQYVEAHHIIELHKLLPGSYCSDNIIVVCPTCHRKLHFANVAYAVSDSTKVQVTINEEVFQFTRLLLSIEAGI